MKLSTRLTITLVAVALLAVTAVGLILDRSFEATILPKELAFMKVATKGLANELESFVGGTRADVLAVRGSKAIENILQARRSGVGGLRAGDTEAAERERLVSLFAAQLEAQPSYLQFRLIGVADGGREIVRVDRSGPGGSIRTVPDAELQHKGNRDYFLETLRFQPGQLYVSPIELNQEHGVVEIPRMPVIRVGTPVATPDGEIAGIVILNVDLRRILSRLRAGAGPGESIFLVNDQGDYLLHPEESREFGFDLGKRFQFQGDFPGLFQDFDWDHESVLVTRDATGNRLHVIVSPLRLAEDVRVALIKTIPDAVMQASLALARKYFLLAGVLVAVVAIGVALVLARSLTKPLERMTKAVDAFRLEEPVNIPTEAAGEIGVLARAFQRMSVNVKEKTEALKHEIQERNRAEQQKELHAEKERLFAAVIDSSLDAVLTKNLDGVITGWNPAAEALYGYAAREAIGRSVELIVPEDRRGEIRDILEKIRRGDRIATFETVRVHKDGHRIEISLTVSPVKSITGAIVGASAFSRDIEARKKDEERFRMAVESSPSGMVMSDGSGIIVMVNAETERLFGYSREELIGKPVEILVPSRLREQHLEDRSGYLECPQVKTMGAGRDLYGLRRDGSEFPVEIGLNPIDSRDGLHVLSAIVDITERKEAEKALADQTRELQRSNAELEQFAYVASHDLQEPLRMVASYTELLGDRYRGKLDEKADKYIEYAVDGARRMQRLINDLLAYSRVGIQVGDFQPTNVEAVLRLVLRQMNALIEETGAGIAVGPMPTVAADELQLGLVFQNLIGNAIKFRGQEVPQVRVDAQESDGVWVFSVRDNGIGIDKNHSRRLFQMFQRLHERGKYEGNGIGLAISRKIVERHGGSIWFDSDAQAGTTFYFTIPKGSES